MGNNKLTKTFTLSGFVILLTGFIAFKSGTFDKYFNSASNDMIRDSEQQSNLEAVAVDTPNVRIADSIRYNPTMMSTSKSTISIEQKLVFPQKSDPHSIGADTIKSDTHKLIQGK